MVTLDEGIDLLLANTPLTRSMCERVFVAELMIPISKRIDVSCTSIDQFARNDLALNMAQSINLCGYPAPHYESLKSRLHCMTVPLSLPNSEMENLPTGEPWSAD